MEDNEVDSNTVPMVMSTGKHLGGRGLLDWRRGGGIGGRGGRWLEYLLAGVKKMDEVDTKASPTATLTEMGLGGGCRGLFEQHHGRRIRGDVGGSLEPPRHSGGIETQVRPRCSPRRISGTSNGGVSWKTTPLVMVGGAKARATKRK